MKGISIKSNDGRGSTMHMLRRMFGCTKQSLAIYRITVGSLLLVELCLRFRFLRPFYSDEGTLPLELLLPKVSLLYKVVCIHCNFGSLYSQQIMLSIQCICAFLFIIGYKTKLMSVLSWFLYLSLTLRNTWLNFILDRYFHYLLFYSMFLPLDCWSITRPKKESNTMVLSMATIAIKLQVLWIYLDAGGGKYMDPLGGWTYNADPLPALDTYTRHTTAARWVYGLLRPQGLRIMTPLVVYVELLSAPVSFIGSMLNWPKLTYGAIGLVCSLHIGIAITLNNTVLLSLIACSAWTVFLPLDVGNTDSLEPSRARSSWKRLFSSALILSLIAGSFWFEIFSEECSQSMKHIWSVLLHNRWNVFVGAEEYVTWEIAPGLLADGSVADIWGRTDDVNWKMPGAGAPCTSTSRPGRWRSFPYLAELDGEDGEALWFYLCDQWDRENDIINNPGRKLIKYNFFMLQADVLPEMGFSATRKRLIKSYDCLPRSTMESQEKERSRDQEEEKATADSSFGREL